MSLETLPPSLDAFDKTNPMSPPPALLGPTVWGLPGVEAQGNILRERKATESGSEMFPEVTKYVVRFPPPTLQLTKQSHGDMGFAVPAEMRPVQPWLPPRQVRAVRLLLAGHGVGSVARALGVARQTVSRWMRNPVFRAEVRGHALSAVPLSASKKAPRT